MTPEKPAYGSPCNSCGLCCRNEICPLGAIVFPRAFAPCPALERDGDREVCGLIANPSRYAPIRTSVYGNEVMSDAAAIGVGAGIGCDARLIEERDIKPPEDFLKRLAEVARSSARTRRKILPLWRNPR